MTKKPSPEDAREMAWRLMTPEQRERANNESHDRAMARFSRHTCLRCGLPWKQARAYPGGCPMVLSCMD